MSYHDFRCQKHTKAEKDSNFLIKSIPSNNFLFVQSFFPSDFPSQIMTIRSNTFWWPSTVFGSLSWFVLEHNVSNHYGNLLFLGENEFFFQESSEPRQIELSIQSILSTTKVWLAKQSIVVHDTTRIRRIKLSSSSSSSSSLAWCNKKLFFWGKI